MTEKEFKEITRRCNWVAWRTPWNNGVWALAYMTGDSWFDEAINYCNDGDMGKKNEFGVYGRHWINDSIEYDKEGEYRLMTDAEIMLYITHLEGHGISKETLIGNYKYDLFNYYVDCWVDCVNHDFDSFVKVVKQKYLKK